MPLSAKSAGISLLLILPVRARDQGEAPHESRTISSAGSTIL